MKTSIFALAFVLGISTSGFAQQTAPATPSTADAPPTTEVFLTQPSGTTITNFYEQTVYDPADNTIGDVADVLVDKQGKITALMIGVGGFLGIGEKHVAVPFSAVRASKKDDKWYLVMDTTKEVLKMAPGFKYDKSTTTWTPTPTN